MTRGAIRKYLRKQKKLEKQLDKLQRKALAMAGMTAK